MVVLWFGSAADFGGEDVKGASDAVRVSARHVHQEVSVLLLFHSSHDFDIRRVLSKPHAVSCTMPS